MAKNDLSWLGFFIRLLFALVLVYTTYNPSGYSFYHWAKEALLAEPLCLQRRSPCLAFYCSSAGPFISEQPSDHWASLDYF